MNRAWMRDPLRAGMEARVRGTQRLALGAALTLAFFALALKLCAAMEGAAVIALVGAGCAALLLAGAWRALREETVIVLLTVEVSYRTYTIEHSFPVSVVKDMRRKDAIERVEDALFQLEQETRTDEALVLPEQLGEVGISLQKQEHGQAMTWVIFGIVLAAALPVWLYAKWKEERKKRNNVLMEQYPSFVNRLWLLLGSGMTVQTGIRQILSEMEKDWLLRRELEYAMHQLDTGSEESWVYEQLGRRLELPEYYQLLQHISQYIRMGTKDLRNLMEQEMQQALEKRRELAKKKGEEASTKLLFPMILLLVLVMVMIVYPAWVGL